MKIIPEWISHQWRKGSMGASEKKTYWAVCTIFTVIFLIIYSLMYFGVGDTFLKLYYSRSGGGWHFVSWVCAVISIYGIWKAPDIDEGDMSFLQLGGLTIGMMGLAILTGAGFDFTL